ncbi:MAG: DsbA family protein [Acidimicrobiales bacterium]|nr:DsbA family protein [Acidimicrobiales bacterium]
MALIEVYADIWCPFTHVGLRSVVRRREQLGRDDVIARVLSWPLELVNGKPLDPMITANHVDDLPTQVAPDLFTGFDPEHFPRTTLPALTLAAAAYRQDGRIGETVSLALREALFEKGRDISHPDVLADMASAHGVASVDAEDHEAVRREWHEGESRGVKGSPHFFCGDINVFCPSLDISTDEEGHLRLQRNFELLNVFLADCFGEENHHRNEDRPRQQ